MNFNNNLVFLRKREGLSQEDLADKLNVSRQTIYKWETGATYPDMDKLLDMTRIFNISLDDLVNKELTEEETIPLSKKEIIAHYKKFSLILGLAIFTILFAVALNVFFQIFTFSNNELIGTIIMLSLIFFAVLTIVYQAISFESFKKENVLKVSFTKQEASKESASFRNKMIVGLSLIFLGIIGVVCSALVDNEKIQIFSAVVLLIFIGLSVLLFIHAGIIHELYNDTDKSLAIEKSDSKSIIDNIPGIIMMLAVIAFFIWGFSVEDGFKDSWLVFPIGGLLCGISSIIVNGIKESQKNKLENKK